LFKRFHFVVLAAGLLVSLSACGLNAPGANPTVIVTAIPTNTLAPLLTQTPRFTATPLPSPTFIPTPTVSATSTLPPPTATILSSATPTLTIKGVLRNEGAVINMRLGPGTTYKIIGNLKSASTIVVIATTNDQKWALIQLDDGSEGWISTTLVTLANPSVTVPALSTPELTARAVAGTAAMLTQTASAPKTTASSLIAASAPTHPAQINTTTDVLAYCDQGVNAVRNKKFIGTAKIVVFWSWIAKTPEQIKDQLNYGQYEVKIDGQLIGGWQQFASAVTQQPDTSYIVYWFVPLAQQSSGMHKIDYKLTWKQTIYDGINHFGPGTDHPADTGTCSFTVK